ncbi:hypothetical protein C0J52_13989 [Blattella germanica]|nr:hypothetical protein C0J52_13989 [Blattella germanica]
MIQSNLSISGVPGPVPSQTSLMSLSLPYTLDCMIGCRLWNLSIVSVLILTFSNILLTVRLLHSTDCSRQASSPSQPVRIQQQQQQYQEVRSQETSHSPVASPPPCRPPNTTTRSLITGPATTNTSIFRIDLRLGRWDSRHLYKLFDFALPGERYAELSDKYSVCLATQSSLEKLQSLVQVAHHWTGPISAAVFAAGDEYPLLQLYIAFLRRCFPVVRDRVSFHLAYPKDRPPTHLRPDFPTKPKLDCRRPEAALSALMRLRKPETAKWRVKAAYPQNHLRNLARRNCQTPYVFLTDVDIIPSARLAEGLDVFLKNAKCKNLCAYVIPTYELDERVYEMFVAGYQFQVLSPIFTCHWGLQNKKGRPSWRERQNSMNRRHFETFKSEVFARYRKDPLKMLAPKKPAKKR